MTRFYLMKIGEDCKRVESCPEPGAPTPAQRNLLLAAINPLFVTEYLSLKLQKNFQIAANVNLKTVPCAYNGRKSPVFKEGIQFSFSPTLSCWDSHVLIIKQLNDNTNDFVEDLVSC